MPRTGSTTVLTWSVVSSLTNLPRMVPPVPALSSAQFQGFSGSTTVVEVELVVEVVEVINRMRTRVDMVMVRSVHGDCITQNTRLDADLLSGC